MTTTTTMYGAFLDRRARSAKCSAADLYFRTFRADFELLPRIEVLLLSAALNYGRDPRRVDADGWMWLAPRFLRDGCGLADAEQIAALRGLVAKGLAEVRYVEDEATGKRRRMVRFDLARWQAVIDGRITLPRHGTPHDDNFGF